jgi:hypothetical protein
MARRIDPRPALRASESAGGRGGKGTEMSTNVSNRPKAVIRRVGIPPGLQSFAVLLTSQHTLAYETSQHDN